MIKLNIKPNPKQLCQNLNEQRKCEKNTDAIFVVPGVNRKWAVHKCVISAKNSDLALIIQETSSKNIFLVHGVNAKQMDVLLEFLYTDNAEIALEDAKLIHEGAVKLNISDLAKNAINAMIKNVNIHNCLAFWRYGVQIEEEPLINACKGYINKNHDEFFKSYLKLIEIDEFLEILNMRTFKTSTTDTYRYFKIVEWVKSDSTENAIHFENLLIHTCFTKIPYDIFQGKISKDRSTFDNIYFNEKFIDASLKFNKDGPCNQTTRLQSKKPHVQFIYNNNPNLKNQKSGKRRPSTSK